MTRRSNLLRHVSVEPSYFSRFSRGVLASSAFERRYVPGIIGLHEQGATILPFAPNAGKIDTADQSAAAKTIVHGEIA